MVSLSDGGGVAHGYGRLDDDDGVGVDLEHEFDDFFDVRRVEVVFHSVVVGGCGYDDEFSVGVGRGSVGGEGEVEVFLFEVFFDVVVLDR